MLRVLTFESGQVPLYSLNVITRSPDISFPSTLPPCVYLQKVSDWICQNIHNWKTRMPASFRVVMRGLIASDRIHSVKFQHPQLQFIYLDQVPSLSFCEDNINLIFGLIELHADISFLNIIPQKVMSHINTLNPFLKISSCCLIHMSWAHHAASATYFASVIERTTESCLLVLHEMRDEPKKNEPFLR